MKIRNLPYDELNRIEKEMVERFFKSQHEVIIIDEIPFFECKNHSKCNTIRGFWEAHRDIDTDFGKYNGWSFGDEVTDMLANKIQNENCQ